MHLAAFVSALVDAYHSNDVHVYPVTVARSTSAKSEISTQFWSNSTRLLQAAFQPAHTIQLCRHINPCKYKNSTSSLFTCFTSSYLLACNYSLLLCSLYDSGLTDIRATKRVFSYKCPVIKLPMLSMRC